MPRTDAYQGMLAETTTVRGANGDLITAYAARPLGPGPFPGMVLLHHMPGWDDWYFEATRTFAARGYNTISPNLYHRLGHGTSEEVAVQVRAAGGVPDDQVVADAQGCIDWLRSLQSSNGKVGCFGTCSGGRHTYLVACRATGLDAAADLWGGGVVMEAKDLTANRPVSPVDYTKDLQCPLLGLFGNDDRAPTPEQVDIHEAELKKHGKDYEFHRYDGAGHGFFYHVFPQAYRAEQAVDGWKKVWDFFGRHLGS